MGKGKGNGKGKDLQPQSAANASSVINNACIIIALAGREIKHAHVRAVDKLQKAAPSDAEKFRLLEKSGESTQSSRVLILYTEDGR